MLFSVGSPNNKMSSTKKTCDSSYNVETFTPSRNIVSLALCTILLSASATSKNKKGDSGNPYLNHREGWKKEEGDPFIITTKEAD